MSDLPTYEDLADRDRVTPDDLARACDMQAAAGWAATVLRYAARKLQLAGLRELGGEVSDLASDAQVAHDRLEDVIGSARFTLRGGRE